jgi:hypothetical protein
MAFGLWASLLQFTKKSDSKIKSCNLADIKYVGNKFTLRAHLIMGPRAGELPYKKY